MKKHNLFRAFTLAASILATGLVHAGTYSIVSGPDTTLLGGSYTGIGSVSWSTSGSSLIINLTANAQNIQGLTVHSPSTANITGTAYWTVRWTEGYPGEPAPTTRPVTVHATPSTGTNAIEIHVLASATMLTGSSSMGLAQYSSLDDFDGSVTKQVNADSSHTFNPDMFTSPGGTNMWATSTFMLVSPGVYEAQIAGNIDTGMVATASATAAPIPAAASASMAVHMKYTIVEVDGQAV